MRQSHRASLGAGILVAGTMLLFTGAESAFGATEGAKTYTGKAVRIGDGTAHVIITTGGGGQPQTVSVVMSSKALDGLPTEPNKQTPDGAWEYRLPLPATPVKTGYRDVVVDWNPHGHPPPHVYTVPHFDFHFYMIPPAEVKKIHFTGPADPAARVTDKGLIPPGYQVVPETAIDQMGVHALDTEAPELHGQSFTATFIYGYYKNRLIFLEPMVSREFFLTKPDVTLPVKTPDHYSLSAYYPTSYRVQYDPEVHSYAVTLEGLRHQAGK